MRPFTWRIILTNRVALLTMLIILLTVTLSALSPYFLNGGNLLSLTQFSVIVGLLGLGQTLVILGGGGGIDLSTGANLSLSGVIMALAIKHGIHTDTAVTLALGSGTVLGALNGVMVAYRRLPALIITLGTQYLYGSIALGITNGTPLSPFSSTFAWLGQSFTAGIPNQVLFVLIPISVVLWLVLRRTVWGRQIYAVGTNQHAASLVGISVPSIRLSLYVLNGFLAGVAAVVMNSWMNTASPTAGAPYVLDSITVAVLGGTSIFGGEGSIGGTIMAIILFTILQSGFQLANINSVMQLGALGLLLIIAVVINQREYRNRRVLRQKVASKKENV